jgi:hypothetical protein
MVQKIVRIGIYILIAIILAVTFIFIIFNLPTGTPREDVQLGMTYSYRYAEALGLDPKETLTAQLREIGIKEWRLPVYWDLVEETRGNPDYSFVDWQLSEIEKYEGHVILSIGQRVPRWPECHIPAWAQDDQALREEALLEHLERTVLRYKDRQSIVMWQVENEPFLSQFGICPPLDKTYLEREIALVKNIDATRPVLVTDSGELSLWVRAAKRGDAFGTTLYRHIYSHHFGGRYITYPISPSFFQLKTLLVKLVTKQENFMVIELQAEPWAPGWLKEYPLEEQFKTMDETKLRENVAYAKRLGFPTIYLWGGEWWYYVKVKLGYPGLWETGKNIFNAHQ